jgi:hypothetical protein
MGWHGGCTKPQFPFRVGGFLAAGRKEQSMDAVNVTPVNAGAVEKHSRILYPLMLFAAAAVIFFSVAGIAAMMGWIAAG